MRILLKILLATVAGVLLGLGGTWVVGTQLGLPGAVSDGPWHTSLAIGSSTGGAYTRAIVALHGLFALKRSETVYYNATTDDAGDALNGNCRYRVIGHDPDSRWWSITAYGPDDYLIPNPTRHYAVSKDSVRHDDNGRFTITLSPSPAPRNWIATSKGPFSLTLRLYNPNQSVAADPAHARLPKIKKGRCQ